jgi:hypothetical protein
MLENKGPAAGMVVPAGAPGARRNDAVFKTFVEAALLLALSIGHLTVGFSFGALLAATALLVAASLAADAYLFGSIGRAFAARRALHFKASPFIVAATALFFLLPAETDADKLVRWLLAAGIGGTLTGLLNLGGGSRADA